MKIKDSKLFNGFYLGRSYFDIGMNVISYVTGKIPMIAGIIIIANNFDIHIAGMTLVFWVIAALIGAFTIGFIYKVTGLYDLERQKEALLNPVMQEIYDAAKKINKEEWLTMFNLMLLCGLITSFVIGFLFGYRFAEEYYQKLLGDVK